MVFILTQLLLSALLVDACCSATFEWPIRRRDVLATWQSSFESACFYGQSPTDGSSKVFFSSADASQADNGFQWFALTLKESVAITSVIIKGFVVDPSNHRYGASRNIEVWINNSTDLDLSSEHCGSRRIVTFFSGSNRFSKCGVAMQLKGTEADGGVFVAKCTTHVRTILFLKDTGGRHFMDFSDLLLHLQEERINDDSNYKNTPTRAGLSGASVALVVLGAVLPIAAVIASAIFLIHKRHQRLQISRRRSEAMSAAAKETSLSTRTTGSTCGSGTTALTNEMYAEVYCEA